MIGRAADLDSYTGVELATTFAVIPDGVYTVSGPLGHRTFEVSRNGEAATFAPGRRTVSLLTGPNSWATFGFVSDLATKHPISVWQKLRGPENHPSDYEKFARVLTAMIVNGHRRFTAPDGQLHDYKILVARPCISCGRMLSTPESVARGIGPECAKKG